MFEYISGKLAVKAPTCVVIDVGGLGYALEIPISTFNTLPEIEEKVRLLAHFHVREDIQKLYGFGSAIERDVFRHLLGISKIGPKAAISVLSHVSIDDLAMAVESQNPAMLKAVPGIGPKTAQRLVMELKGKISSDMTGGGAGKKMPKAGGTPAISRRDEAFVALVSLGYTEAQVQKALARVEEALGIEMAVEERIKKALQVI